MTDINYKKKYFVSNNVTSSPASYRKEYVNPKELYLIKSNFLSEFSTDYEKKLAKESLGVKDGITYYTWIKYASDSEGTDISDNPIGKSYIGISNNQVSDVPSDNPKDYKWSLIKETPYEEAIEKGLVKNYSEWLDLIRGPQGLKGEDGTLSFEELTDSQKSELANKSITDTQLDANSTNPISNSAIYSAFSDLILKYLDLLNINISLSNTITSMLDQMLHLGIPVLMVTDDEYETLEKNSLINPEALYLTTDETSAIIKDLSGSWTFGGLFPITFGTITEQSEQAFVFPGTFPFKFGTTKDYFTFGDTFPLTFGLKESSTNYFTFDTTFPLQFGNNN